MSSSLTKPKIEPGVVKDASDSVAEGTWIDSDKIRFVNGLPQTIGGFSAVSATAPDSIAFDSVVFDEDVFNASLVSTTEMYPGQVRAAHAWTDLDGTDYLAWGTGAGLFVMYNSLIYDITPADFDPENSSATPVAYGSGAYGSGPYTNDATRVMWSLDNWGENLLACARGQSLWEWTPGDDKALLIEEAPTPIQFMFVSPERIVVLLGTEEFGGVYNPMLVRWSDQGDNTQWTPATNNLAGEFPLSQGSKLISGLAVRGLNLLWSDDAPYTMQFTGSPSSVYVIRAVGHGCGIAGPQARCSNDSAVMWMSRDNFYVFTGQAPQIIPSTVREDIFNNLDQDNIEKCHAGWNTGYGEPWFFYPDLRDNTGECSRYGMVNKSGHWAVGAFDRTAWVSANVFPYPIAFSANDRIVYEHELPGQGGASLGAFVESGFVDIGDGGTLFFIKRIVPDFHRQGPNIDITLKTRMWPSQTATERGPYTATPTTTKLDMRVKARQIAVRIESSADDAEDSHWALGAIGFDAQPSNEKR
jgi:hypothetical protein